MAMLVRFIESVPLCTQLISMSSTNLIKVNFSTYNTCRFSCCKQRLLNTRLRCLMFRATKNICGFGFHLRDYQPRHVVMKRRTNGHCEIFTECKMWYSSNSYKNDDSATEREFKMKLMELDHILWPNIWKTIRNQIYYKLVQIYFDNKFTISEFAEGAKQAFVFVSDLLAVGGFDELEEKQLVSKEALCEIKSNFSKLSVQQKMLLSVPLTDIYLAFPYEAGIIYDEEKQERFLEIMMVFHCFRGFKEFKEQSEADFNVQKHKSNITIANYRFVREYTKGKEDQGWTINLLNHIRPAEHASY